ncbi:MAG: hypothetical protein C0606_03490 [Hyphomicrobiales bacterium]|nr:MAG: hypothetical protein C0606_03490 [Hyphomicrobiales bacterium]
MSPRLTAVTISVTSSDIAAMSEWLLEYRGQAPATEQDILSDYVMRALRSNSDYDGIALQVAAEEVQS